MLHAGTYCTFYSNTVEKEIPYSETAVEMPALVRDVFSDLSHTLALHFIVLSLFKPLDFPPYSVSSLSLLFVVPPVIIPPIIPLLTPESRFGFRPCSVLSHLLACVTSCCPQVSMLHHSSYVYFPLVFVSLLVCLLIRSSDSISQ